MCFAQTNTYQKFPRAEISTLDLPLPVKSTRRVLWSETLGVKIHGVYFWRHAWGQKYTACIFPSKLYRQTRNFRARKFLACFSRPTPYFGLYFGPCETKCLFLGELCTALPTDTRAEFISAFATNGISVLPFEATVWHNQLAFSLTTKHIQNLK